MAVLAHAAAAASDNREKWIVGRWTASAPQRPDRIVVFHPDHTWGVEGYIPSSSNPERLITREDNDGAATFLLELKPGDLAAGYQGSSRIASRAFESAHASSVASASSGAVH